MKIVLENVMKMQGIEQQKVIFPIKRGLCKEKDEALKLEVQLKNRG